MALLGSVRWASGCRRRRCMDAGGRPYRSMRPHAGPLCTARTEWAPELSPAGRRIVIYSWPRAGCSVDHDRLGVLPITKRLPAPTSIDGSNVRWLERCAWRLNTPRRTKSDWRRRTITMPTGARRSATASS
jgi:hypothetical protein